MVGRTQRGEISAGQIGEPGPFWLKLKKKEGAGTVRS